MRISKFKKYITWNIISLLGYISIIITISFLVMLSLSSTQLNMRVDLNKIIYEYIFNHIVSPYVSVYKIQLGTIIFLLLGSIAEKKYYDNKESYGFRILVDNDKTYSKFFVIGLMLNFCPLYLFSMYIISIIMKIF